MSLSILSRRLNLAVSNIALGAGRGLCRSRLNNVARHAQRTSCAAPIGITRSFSTTSDSDSEPKNGSSNNNKPSNEEVNSEEVVKDLLLQESYEGLTPRIVTLLDLLVDGSMETFRNTVSDTIILRENKSDSLMRQLLIYADLKNPLVQKYGFDSKDFLEGAKHAVGVTLQHLIGRDLNSFVQGETKSSEASDFLMEVLHPSLYWSKVDAIRNVYNMLGKTNAAAASPMSAQVVKNFKVTVESIGLINIMAEVVRENHGKRVVQMMGNSFVSVSVIRSDVGKKAAGVAGEQKSRGSASASKAEAGSEATKGQEEPDSVSKSSAAVEEEEMDTEVPGIDELDREFPVGSVVLTVRTVVRARYTSLDDDTSDSMLHAITFRGCVSGTKSYQEEDERASGAEASKSTGPELLWKIIDIQQ